MSYSDFLERKAAIVVPTGVDHDVELAPHLFDFQRDLVQWALRRGRAALFADTGLGKSAMQLEWARHVAAHTSKPVLVLAPLAVGPQTVREAERFGSSARMCREGSDVGPGINVLNYDRLHKVEVSQFGGVVLDESSILKAADGKTRTSLIEAFASTPFKLCCSATPAPNDHTELGNHAEFLGVMTVPEMLSMFFVHDGGSTQDWRLKGHARRDFWRWVCSWAAMVRKPSDLGYANEGYDLPPLNVRQHTIAASQDTAKAAGRLFVEAANTLAEQREARRASMDERVAKVAELVAAEPDEQWLIWCELNAEGDALKAAIPGAVQVAGADTQEHKEAAVAEFIHWGESCLSRIGNATTEKTERNDCQSLRNGDSETEPTESSTCRRTTRKNQRSSSAQESSRTKSTEGGVSDTRATRSLRSSARSLPEHAQPTHEETQCLGRPTESHPKTTPGSCLSRAEDAPFAEQRRPHQEATGSYTSTIATTQEKLEASFARAATSGSESSRTGRSLCDSPPNTSRGRVLISKPSIFGYGLNFQSCARMAFCGISHSFEQYYQAVRRCWRFGQKRPVDVHVVVSELEGNVVANLERKQKQATEMAEEMSGGMVVETRKNVRGLGQTKDDYNPTKTMKVPAWIRTEAA